MEERKYISDGGSKYVIMVYGNDLSRCWEADFYKWLRKNDYSNLSHHGCSENTPWVYVNIFNKTFFPQFSGFRITSALHEHAVTIDEFYKILEEYEKNPESFEESETVISIYKKYEGKAPLVFYKERFDCDEGAEVAKQKMAEADAWYKERDEKTLYFLDMHFVKNYADEDGSDYIIEKSKITKKSKFPKNGTYKALVHQQSIPGGEYFDCEIEFTDDLLRLKNAEMCGEGAEYLRDIRVWK